ncbi:site-specific integrase [uncultured Sulfitobacter sp.]|uniref:site-specific integrase n=1 Tax=uncultured Sulfitobacter sp. TaxID=191468 RepID=UPI002615DDE0|nr:site-specific integrase [uncultured Sulfitobacter sp.]
MALAAHTVRRSAIYYWRRRLPAALGGKTLLISLQTPDPNAARRLAALVTAESVRAFEDMTKGRADHASAVERLRRVIQDESPYPLPARRPPQPRTTAEPRIETYSASTKAVAARLMAQKRKAGMSEAMIAQMTKVFDLFREITGVQDMRLLRQHHLAAFVDILEQLPQSYRKSPKDRSKPIRQIIADTKGREVRRLSATTINRNLDYLGQLFTKARAEGVPSVGNLDLGALRQRKTLRERDERPAFTADDVQMLFAHPLWHGWKDKIRWQESGTRLVQDGFYWVPLIAALTGARREEIAALKAAEITVADGLPALIIAPNANRGLKSLTAKRDLPLHPQLVELGLNDHAARQIDRHGPQADLFPDLRPRKGAGFGGQLDYRFRKLVQAQLDGNPEGKVFHSLRHYVATQLGRIADLPEPVRKDILGHAGGSITAERYSETTPLAVKAEAIGQLPWLPVVHPDHKASR